MNTSYGLAGPPSPCLEQVFKIRMNENRSRNSIWWTLLNTMLAGLIFIEVYYGMVMGIVILQYPSLWYIEICLAMLFGMNAIIGVLRYLVQLLSPASVQLTGHQKRLLGVRPNELYVREASPLLRKSLDYGADQSLLNLSSRPASNISNPSLSMTRDGPYSYSPSGSPYTPTMAPGSPYTPPQMFANSSAYSPTQPPYSPVSLDRTPNYSMSFNQSADSFGIEGLCINESGSQLRSRFRNLARSPSFTDDKSMNTMKDYEMCSREEENKDQVLGIANQDNSTSSTYGRSALSYSSFIKKFPYQITSRSPKSVSSRIDDVTNDTYDSDECWSRLGVTDDQLDQWVESVRRYLSQTVVVRVSEEISAINKQLRRLGLEDMEIGEVSLATLKMVAITKGPQLLTLNRVIQFLEVSSNQEYVVARIHELAKGGCMTDFNWSSGMEYKDKPWAEHLPTDSSIVMHLLCTYLDARLPPHPKYPDGRTFTSQHSLKSPDKPNLKKKDNLIIYQSKINPPHFKVIKGEQLWDLHKGRNNMFHAILLFLYLIKTQKDGMLDRIDLGPSGINLLWVLEAKT